MADPDGLRLTVVGCAPAWTRRPGRASSCYIVESAGRALVLDLGQGAFSELARYRPPESIDGVLISHLHADHLVDLVPLRHFLQYEARAEGRIALHGPRDLRARLDGFQAQRDFLGGLPGAALEPGTFDIAGFTVEARHVTHIPDSFAFRISVAGEGGPGLVYSGDCARADDLLPLIQPTDTLLCEAALGSGEAEPGMHLNADQAAGAAADGGAARLVLTHVLDGRDGAAAREAAATRYGGEVTLAEPGLVVEVQPR